MEVQVVLVDQEQEQHHEVVLETMLPLIEVVEVEQDIIQLVHQVVMEALEK